MKRKALYMDDVETLFTFLTINFYGNPQLGDVIRVLREMAQEKAFEFDDGKEEDDGSC